MRKFLIRCVLISLCISLCLAPLTAFAASTTDAKEKIDTNAECTLTIRYVYDKQPFPDARARLYYVASVSPDLQYALTEPYQGTGLELNGIDAVTEWNTVRTTLKSVIWGNRLEPDYIADADKDGSAVFNSLKPGLYLLMPETIAPGNYVYTFHDALIMVPGLNEEGRWDYDVKVTPKARVDVFTGEEGEKTVVKLWRGDKGSKDRPESITAEILCNGKVVQTVVLSAENNWSYTWKVTDNGDEWLVVERNVPEGYVMTVDENTASFVITNTDSDNDEPPRTGDSSNIGFYIMLLCTSGILLVIVGIAAKRKPE